jgi:hypothetical protein
MDDRWTTPSALRRACIDEYVSMMLDVVYGECFDSDARTLIHSRRPGVPVGDEAVWFEDYPMTLIAIAIALGGIPSTAASHTP